jgi:hypothetical protein
MTNMGYRHCERSVAIHEPVDCHVAALLAMTDMGYRHCERSVAIHAPGDCRVAALLAMTDKSWIAASLHASQ